MAFGKPTKAAALFFLIGMAASAEEKSQIDKLKKDFPDLRIRNGSAHGTGDTVEAATAVFGAFPEVYKDQKGCKCYGDGYASVVAAVKAKAEAARKEAEDAAAAEAAKAAAAAKK